MNLSATDQAPSAHPPSDASGTSVGSFANGDAHPAYDPAGVDRSLIRWMLSLTPSERLRHVQGTIDLVSGVNLDIVYALSEPNISRLELALTELGAVFRDDPRRIVPNRSHLRSRGHKLLQTFSAHISRHSARRAH